LTFNFTSLDPNDKSMIYEGSANPVSSAIQPTINQQGKGMFIKKLFDSIKKLYDKIE